MFANAIGYEQLMGRWSVRLAPLYTDFARLRDVGRILDVGCGTGALVKTMAHSTKETEIVGVDPAQSLRGVAPQGAYVASLSDDRQNGERTLAVWRTACV